MVAACDKVPPSVIGFLYAYLKNMIDTLRCSPFKVDAESAMKSTQSSIEDYHRLQSIIACNLERQAKQLKRAAQSLRKGARDLRKRVADPSMKHHQKNPDVEYDHPKLFDEFFKILQDSRQSAQVNIMIAGDIINNCRPRS